MDVRSWPLPSSMGKDASSNDTGKLAAWGVASGTRFDSLGDRLPQDESRMVVIARQRHLCAYGLMPDFQMIVR